MVHAESDWPDAKERDKKKDKKTSERQRIKKKETFRQPKQHVKATLGVLVDVKSKRQSQRHQVNDAYTE